MDEKYKTLLTSSFDAYLELLNQEDFPPGCSYLSYDFDFLRHGTWHLLGREMVACDLRELTNLLNRWLYSLKRWHAWNQIVSQHDEDTSWALRGEFLDAFAREGLLKPSALRDIFTSVATSALHQAKLGQAIMDLPQESPVDRNHPRRKTPLAADAFGKGARRRRPDFPHPARRSHGARSATGGHSTVFV